METMINNINNFIEKYWETIQSACSEKEYWALVCNCLLSGNIIDEESCEIIKIFLSESVISILTERKMDVLEKEERLKKLLDKIFDMDRLCRERENINKRCAGKDSTYKAIWMYTKVYGENIERFVNVFYKEIHKHLIMTSICEGKYEKLKIILGEKCCHKRYGNKMTLEGDYYCPSATMDLIIGNVKRGRLLKKIPQSLSDKIEYIYDEKGDLLAYKWYATEEKLYTCNFLIYAGDYVFDIEYTRKEALIDNTCLRRYDNNRINYLENVRHNIYDCILYGYIYKMRKEEYEYSELGILKKCTEEEYNFPYIYRDSGASRKKEKSDKLDRLEHEFVSDEEEKLRSFTTKRFMGENMIRSWSCDLPESKRKTTGKDSLRWKRPNCFIKM